MTIIMGITLQEGAAVAADTLRHNAVDNGNAGHADKTVAINNRVVGAKAGYGPDADAAWQALIESGIEGCGPAEIAQRLRVIGARIYSQCREKAVALGVADPGLFFILAGLELNGRPAIHWLNFALGDFGHTNQVGCAIAFASRPEANANAVAHARALVRQDLVGQSIPLDAWARNLTADEKMYAPHAIEFPIILRIVKAHECVEMQVFENGIEREAAVARIA